MKATLAGALAALIMTIAGISVGSYLWTSQGGLIALVSAPVLGLLVSAWIDRRNRRRKQQDRKPFP